MACGSGTSTQSGQPVRSVKTMTLRRATMSEKDFAAMATPDEAVNLAFKLSGQILDIPPSTGERVERGELLARLDPQEVELQVAADRSKFEQAQSQMNRMERLYEREAVSKQDVEVAQTTFEQARSAYENSLDLLSHTTITAPFAGVIERTYVDIFQRVSAGETILRLVAPLTLTVEFTLPENGLAPLRDTTTHFEVRFDKYPNRIFTAKLDSYTKTSSDASGFPVSLKITNAKQSIAPISPGLSCTVTMLIAESNPQEVAVPISAIYALPDSTQYLWVVGKDSVVHKHKVTLGSLAWRDRVIIKSGVEPDERIVTAGVYQLRDGQKVRILNQ